MTTWHAMRAGLLAVAGMSLFACSDDETTSPDTNQITNQTDGATAADGATGDAMGTGGVSAEAAPPAPSECGGQMCGTPIGAEIADVTTCCMDDESCGLTSPTINGTCLAPSQPGRADPSCAGFDDPRAGYQDGCCGPSGCGALNPWIGCIGNADLGRATVACEYDPTNTCDVLAAVTCDGAEDCPSGEICCGRYDGANFVEFGCFSSCGDMPATGSNDAAWRQICHAADTCENPMDTCTTSQALPPTLTRCISGFGSPADPATDSSAGRINCGSTLCEVGEQCCLREPGGAYCAPSGTRCRCQTPDSG